MSHDRGCFKCNREPWDYADCRNSRCVKAATARSLQKAIRERQRVNQFGISREECERLLLKQAQMFARRINKTEMG